MTTMNVWKGSASSDGVGRLMRVLALALRYHTAGAVLANFPCRPRRRNNAV